MSIDRKRFRIRNSRNRWTGKKIYRKYKSKRWFL